MKERAERRRLESPLFPSVTEQTVGRLGTVTQALTPVLSRHVFDESCQMALLLGDHYVEDTNPECETA